MSLHESRLVESHAGHVLVPLQDLNRDRDSLWMAKGHASIPVPSRNPPRQTNHPSATISVERHNHWPLPPHPFVAGHWQAGWVSFVAAAAVPVLCPLIYWMGFIIWIFTDRPPRSFIPCCFVDTFNHLLLARHHSITSPFLSKSSPSSRILTIGNLILYCLPSHRRLRCFRFIVVVAGDLRKTAYYNTIHVVK